jgi:hypothetical protein
MQEESSQAKCSGGNNILHRVTPLAEEERTVLLHSQTVPLLSNEPQTLLLFVDTTYYSFITFILQGTHNARENTMREDKDILYPELQGFVRVIENHALCSVTVSEHGVSMIAYALDSSSLAGTTK